MSGRAFGIALAAPFALIGGIAWAWSGAPWGWPFVISGALLVAGLLSPLSRAILPTPPPRVVMRRAVRVAAWNAVFLLAGLLLVALGGEAWLRLQTPFLQKSVPDVDVPEVGRLFAPHADLRFTNVHTRWATPYWTTARANSLGFLDREPPGAERAAASCHIAFIGDSFVEARQVAVKDKLHVRLEAAAARELPGLDVAASAFGLSNTGQSHQLPLYDHFARRLRPNLVVLVFVPNDFADNHPALWRLEDGWDPDAVPYAAARRRADGTIYLSPPNPDGEERLPAIGQPVWRSVYRELTRRSAFAGWLERKLLQLNARSPEQVIAWAEEISRRPGYESFLVGWDPGIDWGPALLDVFTRTDPPPAFQDALDFTAFALDEFMQRTERDGAGLVILASHTMGPSGDPLFRRMAEMAGERGIPVVNQYDYIKRRGRNISDSHFGQDLHWNEIGHQMAADLLLEWLREHPRVCDDEPDSAPRRAEIAGAGVLQ